MNEDQQMELEALQSIYAAHEFKSMLYNVYILHLITSIVDDENEDGKCSFTLIIESTEFPELSDPRKLLQCSI